MAGRNVSAKAVNQRDAEATDGRFVVSGRAGQSGQIEGCCGIAVTQMDAIGIAPQQDIDGACTIRALPVGDGIDVQLLDNQFKTGGVGSGQPDFPGSTGERRLHRRQSGGKRRQGKVRRIVSHRVISGIGND